MFTLACYIFHQIWEFFSHYISGFFFFSFITCPAEIPVTCIGLFHTISYAILIILFQSFFSFTLVWVVSYHSIFSFTDFSPTISTLLWCSFEDVLFQLLYFSGLESPFFSFFLVSLFPLRFPLYSLTNSMFSLNFLIIASLNYFIY